MKKIRFAVWFTALLAVFTFSSCLDSENGGQRQGTEIVKVAGMMGMYSFHSASGFELIPSNMSQITMNIDTQYALITYSYDSGQVTETTKKVPVEVYSILPIESRYPNPSLDGMKEFANAPVCAISAGNSMSYFPISFWDAENMFLPIYYYIKDVSNKDDMTKELNSHHFELYYDVNDENAMEDELVIYVRHNVADPSLNKDRKGKYNLNIYHVNLMQIVSEFEREKGTKPSKLLVKYEENNSTGEYDPHYVMEGKAEVDYSYILKNFQKK